MCDLKSLYVLGHLHYYSCSGSPTDLSDTTFRLPSVRPKSVKILGFFQNFENVRMMKSDVIPVAGVCISTKISRRKSPAAVRFPLCKSLFRCSKTQNCSACGALFRPQTALYSAAGENLEILCSMQRKITWSSCKSGIQSRSSCKVG